MKNNILDDQHNVNLCAKPIKPWLFAVAALAVCVPFSGVLNTTTIAQADSVVAPILNNASSAVASSSDLATIPSSASITSLYVQTSLSDDTVASSGPADISLSAILTSSSETSVSSSASSANVMVSLAEVTSSSASASSSSISVNNIQVSSDGEWMIDDQGRTVLLHGVNVVQKNAPYYPSVTDPSQFTATDAQWLVQNGFNAIRLGVLFEGVMPQKGVIDESYLDNLNKVVQLCAANGIYVDLDFHQDDVSSKWGGDGFPDWAVQELDDGIPSPPGINFGNALVNPATEVAFQNFWDNQNGVLDNYIQAQQAVASYFVNKPYILGIELFNEPNNGLWEYLMPLTTIIGDPIFDSILASDYAKMRAAIRAVAPTMPILEEPSQLNQFYQFSWLPSANDSNTIFAFHDYGFSNTDLPIIPSLAEGILWGMASQETKNVGGPGLLTEFGATDDDESLVRTTASANANLTGWFYWSYKGLNDPATIGPDTESLFTDDSDVSTVKPNKLLALEQTYPQATAGIPQSLSFDDTTGAFSYTYTAGDQTAPTEIFVASNHYPYGYNVTVEGATIISQSVNDVAIGEATPGTQVTVIITAKLAVVPTLEVKNSTIEQGAVWTPADNFVSATDSSNNTLSINDASVSNTVDTSKTGNYTVTYTYTDPKSGDTVVNYATVSVVPVTVASFAASIPSSSVTSTLSSSATSILSNSVISTPSSSAIPSSSSSTTSSSNTSAASILKIMQILRLIVDLIVSQ